MSSPAPTAPRLAAGTLLGNRYRLERLIQGPAPTRLWRARDEVLARSVAVRLLEGGAGKPAQALLDAATQAGVVSHPGVASTYDAARQDVEGIGPVTYVVREWVDGTSLGRLLQDGPLSAAEAVGTLHSAALAVAALAERGLIHGALHPGNVLLTYGGGVKVTDAVVSAALAEPASVLHRPLAADRAPTADALGLAATLYAALTARWPGPGAHGLAGAPLSEPGVPCSPRQVRAAVPRDVDAEVLRVLDPARRPNRPPLLTPAAVAAALLPLLADEHPAPAPVPRHSRASSRRLTILGGAAAALAALAVAGYSIGIAVGRVPPPAAALPAFSTSSLPPSAPSGPPARLQVRPIAGARDFNPPPGDGLIRPALDRLAYDGDPHTAWVTEIYDSARLGNLVPGVGLLFDLGRPELVRQADFTFLVPGQAVQLRAANMVSPSASGFTLVGSADPAGRTLVLHPDVAARYWLVWLTRLPAADGGFQGDVAEARFLG